MLCQSGKGNRPRSRRTLLVDLVLHAVGDVDAAWLRLSRATVSLQPGRSSAWMRASPSASTESAPEIRRSAARISATACSVSSPQVACGGSRG